MNIKHHDLTHIFLNYAPCKSHGENIGNTDVK